MTICMLLISCKDEGQELFRINDQFTIYNSVSCGCRTIQIQTPEEKKSLFAKNVIVVLGNTQEFMVQTSPAGAPSTVWSLVKNANVFGKQDMLVLEQSQIDSILEHLNIEFVKDYSDWHQ